LQKRGQSRRRHSPSSCHCRQSAGRYEPAQTAFGGGDGWSWRRATCGSPAFTGAETSPARV